MTGTVTYYRVDLAVGIIVEERPSGYYRGNPEYGRTVFKNLRRAKAAFAKESYREIQKLRSKREAAVDRLRQLRREIGPLTSRDALKARAFSPHQPEMRA